MEQASGSASVVERVCLPFRSNATRHGLVGAAFGLLFVITATIVDLRLRGLTPSLSAAGQVQRSEPLLWIIDSAPIVMGLIAALAGSRQDALAKLAGRLEQVIGQRTSDLEREYAASQMREAENRRQRQYLEAVVQNSPVAILTLDNLQRIVSCNPAFCHLFGYTPDEIIDRELDPLLTNDDTLEEAEQYTRRSSKGEVVHAVTRRRRKDGSQVDVELFGVPVMVEGEQIGALGLYHDLTQQRRAQAEVESQKQYWETLVQNSPVAIVILDLKERVVSCNPAFEKLFGYTQDEVIGQPIDALIVAENGERAAAAAYTQRAMSGEMAHGIVRRRRKDGTTVDVELFGLPVSVDGQRVGVVGMYHDITDLVRARREAEEADRAKSEFLANMSHEIRTPMNGVLGMLELALDTSLTEEQRDFLSTAHESAEALLSLINDILDFSKIEAGHLELEEISFNLRTMVEGVVDTLAHRAEAKGLEMACDIQEDCPSYVRGDPGRLRQILVNLVGNAIKFTEHGEVVVRVAQESQSDGRAAVSFTVTDTGIGIPHDRHAAIFERFMQLDGSTTRKYGGSGLGLAISRELVERMGGDIGVHSQPGKGSSFWFTVPLKTEPEPLRPPIAAPHELIDMPVLIVDDNATSRLIMTRALQGFGCHVSSATNGPEAIEQLRIAARAGRPFRVAFLDMQMPEMDGEETVRAIKGDGQIRHVSIVILTSMGKRGDASRLQALGCDGYLLKPIRRSQLAEALAAVVGQTKMAPSPRRDGLITRHTLSEQKDIRILLAEDNPINSKLAVALLARAGYAVDTVEDGVQAVDAVREGCYGLVLMDVQMPEMDGFDATKQIRTLETGKRHTPIVAMTAHAMKGDRERCLAAGMDDYLPKPLQPNDLYAVLEKWTRSISAARDTGPLKPRPESDEAAGGPMDWDKGLWYCGGDEALFRELVSQFVNNLGDEIAKLKIAAQADDARLFTRVAHAIKGMAATFGADPLAELAGRLESLGFDANLGATAGLIEQLEGEHPRLLNFVAQRTAS